MHFLTSQLYRDGLPKDIIKIRSKLTPFFFTIFEDSKIPLIIGSAIREQYPESFMDFNLTDKKTVYVTRLQILNRRAKGKDFVQSFFAKSISMYEDNQKI